MRKKIRPIDLTRPWYKKAIGLLPDRILGTVVELGAGNGEFAGMVKSKIKDLTLVDLNGRSKIIRADFNQKLPFRSGSFSGVITLEVIEHLVNHKLFIREVQRILKPGGWLIISTPNISWWGYRLFMFMGQPPKKEGYHLRFFSHRSLSDLLTKNGFKLIKTNSFSTIPLINRFLPKKIYPTIRWQPNLIAQDLVFYAEKNYF